MFMQKTFETETVFIILTLTL